MRMLAYQKTSLNEINDVFDSQFHQLAGLKQTMAGVLQRLKQVPLSADQIAEWVEGAKEHAGKGFEALEHQVDQLIATFEGYRSTILQQFEAKNWVNERLGAQAEKGGLTSNPQTRT